LVPPILIPDPLTPSDAVRLARDAFGIERTARRLPGYTDQNFMLCLGERPSEVLKVAPADDNRRMLECQMAALVHLAASPMGSRVPPVVSASDGSRLVALEDPSGQRRWARLFGFLEGRPLVEVKHRSANLIRQFGRELARLDVALEGFDHPGVERDWAWNLTRAMSLLDYLGTIAHTDVRRLVRSGFTRFERRVVPHLPDLEPAVIHNDANDHNVLVTIDDPPRMAGFIDFGDILRSIRLAEPAIAAAYAMFDSPDPLDVLDELVAGYAEVIGITPEERALIPDLAIGRLCTTLVMSAREILQAPDNEYLMVSTRPARDLLEVLMTSTHDAVSRADRSLTPSRTAQEIVNIRQSRFGFNLSISYDRPLKIVRGRGQYLYDESGREYLDLVNNVCHVGHCHPRVVEAGRDQMGVLNTNTRYLHDNLAEYVNRLTDLVPDPLGVCFLVCTGTEANDLALRLARAHTGRRKILVLDHAYHGHSPTLVEISAYKCNGPGGEGMAPHASKIPMPDPFRGLHRGPDAGSRYAAATRRIVDQLQASGTPPGALITESILGCGGQVVLPDGFLAESYRAVRAAEGVCIADEVQVGFGRVGSHFWAFETQNVVPDIVTLGKPIGNGHPLAAVLTTPEIARSFANGMEYFNTFGGNPVSCAIGLAVLDVIEEEGLQAHAMEMGQRLLAGLREIQGRHPFFGDVRGRGLFIGVEMVRDLENLEPAADEAAAVIEAMKDRGILLSTDGPDHNVLKIKPPMVLQTSDIDRVVTELEAVMTELPE